MSVIVSKDKGVAKKNEQPKKAKKPSEKAE